MHSASQINEVPLGFEAAHIEWLKLGGQTIRHKFRDGSQEAFYQTVYWKLVREAIYRRDSYQCRRCGEVAEQVHHLNYLHRGEDHFYPENLVSVCRRCHVLVEFARLAQSRLYSFRYRQTRVQEYLADDPKSANETPFKSLSRLLEYRMRIEDLRKGYETAKACSDLDHKSVEPNSFGHLNTVHKAAINDETKTILDSWHLPEKEKSKRILAMLIEDINKCSGFISEALGSLPNLANPPLDSEIEEEVDKAECKLAFAENESLGKCPKCGARVFDAGLNYACEKQAGNGKSCTFRTGKFILQRQIEPSQITKLLTDGKTDLLEGFVSYRTRRKFEAFLALRNGEVKLEVAQHDKKQA